MNELRQAASLLRRYMLDRNHEIKQVTAHKLLCPVCYYLYTIDTSGIIRYCKKGSNSREISDIAVYPVKNDTCMDMQIKEIIE